MNHQLQLTWVQPCEENDPISNSSFVVILQQRIQKLTCRINRIDQFANSLNSTFAGHSNQAVKVISRNILR